MRVIDDEIVQSCRKTSRKEVAWKHESKWEDNIRTVVECEFVDWIYLG
jgi:hypothetical protein